MARNTNVPFKGRIQKRKTYHLQIITFGLQRAAGPYSRARKRHMQCSKQSPLFDHLVGAGEQRRRHFEAKRAGSRQIDDKFELGRLQDWQIGRLGPLEKAARIAAELAIYIRQARSIAHQPTDFRDLTLRICRGNPVNCGQLGQLDPPAREKRVVADKKRVGPLTHKASEHRLDFAASARVDDLDLQLHGASSRFCVSHGGLNSRRIGGIDQHSHTACCGYDLTQEFEPLCHQLSRQEIDAGHVATRPGQTGDKTNPDRVFRDDEGDGDRGGCRLSGEGRACGGRGDHGDIAANQFSRQRRQPIDLILAPIVFDRDILTLDIAGVLECLSENILNLLNRL
jgi:hypothetical protein